MADAIGGGCFCKAVRFDVAGPIRGQNHCHCESCRKATSSAFTTWITVDKAHVTFSGVAPSVYHSSPGVTRTFCPRCGSPLSYESVDRPGDIDILSACLDDQRLINPARHYFWSGHVPWVKLADDLPRKI